MNQITKLATIGLLPLTMLSVVARAADVGVVAVAQNDVRVQIPGQPKVRRAGAMQSLPDGSHIQVGAGGRAVVVLYKDGSRYQLSAGSAATISENGLKMDTGAPAKTLSALNLQQAKVLRGSRVAYGRSASVTLRDPHDKFMITSLYAGATNQERPVFTWTACLGATDYHVRVQDGDDKVILERDTTQTSLSYPAEMLALKPDVEYVWSVTALLPDPKDNEMHDGIFHVLPGDQNKTLQGELAALQTAAPAEDEDVLNAALRAEIYNKYEMWDDAANIYQDLVNKNPDSAPLHLAFSKLLQNQNRRTEAEDQLKKANQLLDN